MQGWLRDTRYAVRQLRKTPIFTLTAIVTLALGIGANSTIFSWMSSTLFSPVPGANPTGQLIAMTRGEDHDISYPDYLDLRDHTRALSALIGWDTHTVDLTDAGKPQRLWASLTTANYFDVLGVRPLKGRFFEPQEGQKPGGAPVAVLSYRTWQLLFNGDPNVVGRIINLNQHPYTVIGVAPALFQGASTGLRMDIWTPLMMHQQLESNDNAINERDNEWLDVMGTLAPGVTRKQAQQELTVEMQQIARAWPQEHQGRNDIVTYPMWRAPDGANQYLYTMLPPLMAIALVVLLLACVNVASLFLVRSIARRREMAVRLSLGANRSRLVRQLLVESVLVALAGGGLALLITTWSARSFERFVPQADLPIALNMHVDDRVLTMTFLLSTLTGIAFGLLPALRSSQIVPVVVLKEEAGTASGGRHKARLTSALVVVQIALSFLLLVCGGLFLRGFRNAQHANPGFRADHVLLSSIDLFPAGYTTDTGIAFQRELLRRLEQIPGVQSATLSDWSPLGLRNNDETITPEGYAPQRNESLSMLEMQVGPRYLETLRIPLAAGRDINAADNRNSQLVAVVNERFVQQYWPGQNAIGRRVKIQGDWFTVVGVAKNAKYGELEEAPQPFVYWPAFQRYRHSVVLHVRVAGDPRAYTAQVENAVHSLNADMPILDEYPLTRNVEIASVSMRVAGTFVGMFGLVGLTLAAIGIYGVIAYTTRQRMHEIGIRMALGARRRDVFELIVKQGVRLTATGMTFGIICALMLTPLLRSQLYGVAPTDVLTYLGVAFVLSFVALASCCLPAQRAAQVDPAGIFRSE
ncbi:MAG TPA: ABC transporter permease [Silvibacterium sp.]|nr:ABC transporter permease [Silvibacterium sp.]